MATLNGIKLSTTNLAEQKSRLQVVLRALLRNFKIRGRNDQVLKALVGNFVF